MARVSLPFQLLKTFTDKELINFESLLNSAYLSSNKSLPPLLKCLKKLALHHEHFTPALQCTIYKALFEKEKIEDTLSEPQSKKLNRLMNDLLSVAEKFILFESLKSADKYDAMLLYPKLIDRNQLLLYSKRVRAAEKKLSNEKKQGLEYHNQCYEIQKEKARLFFLNNTLAKEDNYDVLLYHADVKYILEKLEYHLAKITLQKKHPNKTFDFKPYYACKTLFSLPQYQQNPLIQLYLLNIDLAEKADDNKYNSLFEALQQYQNIIPTVSLKPIYTNLINYCSLEITKGNLKYYKNIFINYKAMHCNNFLIKDKSIDIAILKNIVTVACRLKEFDWANRMLEENIKYVQEDMRDSVFHFNKGIIEHNVGNYDIALDYFLKVEKVDELHSVNLKVNLLQCFFEIDKNYEEYTQQMINSFRIFLTTTNKLTAIDVKSYKNFIHYFNKLYGYKKIINKSDRKLKIKRTLPELIKLIEKIEYISYKTWLLSKAKAILNTIA